MKESELIKRIWHFARKYKWAFLISYIVLLTELVFMQWLPVLLRDVINYAVYEADMNQFLIATLYYALVYLGYVMCNFLQLQQWQHINNQYVYDIRIACYRKVLRMKPRILADIKTGDVIRSINNDTMEFHHIVQRYAMRIVNAGIGTIVSLVIVAVMKLEIALFMAVMIPVSALISRKIEAKMKNASDEVRQKQGQYSAWTMEMLKGMREVIELACLDDFVDALPQGLDTVIGERGIKRSGNNPICISKVCSKYIDGRTNFRYNVFDLFYERICNFYIIVSYEYFYDFFEKCIHLQKQCDFQHNRICI